MNSQTAPISRIVSIVAENQIISASGTKPGDAGRNLTRRKRGQCFTTTAKTASRYATRAGKRLMMAIEHGLLACLSQMTSTGRNSLFQKTIIATIR